MNELQGEVALVTGATSGIGRASALALAEAGAALMIVGRDADRAERCLAELRAAGGRVEACLGDVADSEFCAYAVAQAVARLGALDVLVNGAGVIRRGDALATTDADWHRIMATNVDGVFFMSRAAIGVMRGRGGRIVNLASTVGLVGCEGMPAYCASKGAVVQLTRAMALDHAGDGIRINAVCPGAVDTPMLVSEHADPGLDRAAVLAMNTASIPQARVPEPREVADVVVFLASPAARHVTGVALPVDGGYTAR